MNKKQFQKWHGHPAHANNAGFPDREHPGSIGVVVQLVKWGWRTVKSGATDG
jgi:hypothetical protein